MVASAELLCELSVSKSTTCWLNPRAIFCKSVKLSCPVVDMLQLFEDSYLITQVSEQGVVKGRMVMVCALRASWAAGWAPWVGT